MNRRPLRVHVLYESSTGGMPHGCSYIRLLLPLSHPSVAAGITLSSSLALTEPYPDVVIIERLWDHLCDLPAFFSLLDRLRRQRIPLLFELDDDLLSVGSRPGDRNWPTTEQKMWLRALLRNADSVLVSTPNLAKRLSHINQQITVIPNALDERLFSAAKEFHPSTGKGQPITCGYMGTFTHLEDLIAIIGPLRRVLARHADRLVFEIVGVGDAPALQEAFRGLPCKIRQVPAEAVPYEQFTAWMHKNLHWDFGIAPLCNNIFTSSKSDIKFLDYAVSGIPGIFADVPAYAGTVRHLQNGLLASTAEEWESALEQMVLDTELRTRLAAAAHAEVWENRMLQTCACQWRQAIEKRQTSVRSR